MRRPGRPTRADAEQLGDLVVDAALALFRRKGFEATSIGAVADACGMSKHTLYRRFPSKEALFMAAVGKDHDGTLGMLAGVDVSGLDALTALRKTCHALFELCVSPEGTELYRMCISAVPKFPMIGAAFARTEQHIQNLLLSLVVEAQAEGHFSQHEPVTLARYLYYSTIGEIWCHSLLGVDYVQDVERRSEVFDRNWSMFLTGFNASRPNAISSARAADTGAPRAAPLQ